MEKIWIIQGLLIGIGMGIGAVISDFVVSVIEVFLGMKKEK